MANPTIEIRSNDATSDASVAKVDMKLEVVVIPVSDVDPAKEFYKRLAGGWMSRRPALSSSRRRAPGARARTGSTVYVLLAGGIKASQTKDIAKTKKMARELKRAKP
jgi:hypothetical protein